MRKFIIIIAFVLCSIILFASKSAQIITTTANELYYNSFLKQNDIVLAANKTYLVSFWAKASGLFYLKSMVSNNNVPISTEYTTKLSKNWRRYQYFITTPAFWNINIDKPTLIFGTAYQIGTYYIDDVTITNFLFTADMDSTTPIKTVDNNKIWCNATNESIAVFGDTFSRYEILNLSGQTIASGVLQATTAQFNRSITDGLYIVKLTKPDGTVLSHKLLVR